MNIPSVEQFISSIVNKYVVTTSATNKGINGFVFDILAQEEATVEAEATDHYVEANYAIQDHIAIRPIMFTLKGFIGELQDEAVAPFISALRAVESLGDIGGLAPKFAQQAAQFYSKAAGVVATVDSYINQANNLSNIFDDKSTSPDAQQQAFDKLAEFCTNRILCTIETPFGSFENMMITRLSAIQREDTKIVSDFTVAFKQIRTVETITGTPPVFSGRTVDAISTAVNKGQVVGDFVDVTSVFMA